MLRLLRGYGIRVESSYCGEAEGDTQSDEGAELHASLAAVHQIPEYAICARLCLTTRPLVSRGLPAKRLGVPHQYLTHVHATRQRCDQLTLLGVNELTCARPEDKKKQNGPAVISEAKNGRTV